MLDENLKNEALVANEQPLIEKTSRVYKPSYSIEFGRTGEVLLYSCEPFKYVYF